MATLTVFPGGTAVDGGVSRGIGSSVSESWASIRTGSGDSHNDSTQHANIDFWADTVSSKWQELNRYICLFDTSALGASATVSAATLSLFMSNIDATIYPQSLLNIYSSNPASNTALTNADYGSLGTAELSTSVLYTALTNSAYRAFALNATGLALISLTGITKLGAREARYDAAGNTPPWVSGNALLGQVTQSHSSVEDPKLVITYTTGPPTYNQAPSGGIALDGSVVVTGSTPGTGGIDSKTVLMLHCDGVDGSTVFTDVSPSAHAMSRSQIKVDTGQSKFGGASAQFQGQTGAWITTPDSNDWNFANGDFTVDFWVRFAATSDQFLIGQFDTVADNGSWHLLLSGGTLTFYFRDVGPTAFSVSRAWAPSTNTWYHVAITRSGPDLRLFLNGVKVGSTYNISTVTLFNSPGVLNIGSYPTSGDVPLNGWLDEIRISKGIARWIADFTPPTKPYDTTISATYNDAPSGGIVGGGAGNSARSLDLTDSGGIVLGGGAPTYGLVRTFTPSGGIVFGGSTTIGPAKLTVRLVSGTTVIASWQHPLLGREARVSSVKFQMPLLGLAPAVVSFGKPKLRLKAKAATTSYTYTVVVGKARLLLKAKAVQGIEPNHMRPNKPKLRLKAKPFTLRITHKPSVGKAKLILRTKPIARAGAPGLVPSPGHGLILTPTPAKPGILVPTASTASHGPILIPTAPEQATLDPTEEKSTLLTPTIRRAI